MTPVENPPDLPGLPTAAVGGWLQRECPELGRPAGWSAEVISGGLSNITYRVQWGSAALIVRRPPLGPVLPRAHDMHREFRVLDALGSTAVPVPETVAFCADDTLIGAPFYVMREVPGTVLRTPEDTGALSYRQRADISEQLVATLADLHAVDPDSVGLQDFGRKGGYAQRQINTWGKQWQRSHTRELPAMDVLLQRLSTAVPPDRDTTIVHGDFRLDNNIITLDGPPRIAAVLDWELSTLGDPLADLGLMLTYWHDLGDEERAGISVAAGLTAWPGFAGTTELADRYAELTGRSIDDLPFYLALAAMKLAVILEGVHARHLGGQSVGAGYDSVAQAVPVLVSRGLRLMSGRTSARGPGSS